MKTGEASGGPYYDKGMETCSGTLGGKSLAAKHESALVREKRTYTGHQRLKGKKHTQQGAPLLATLGTGGWCNSLETKREELKRTGRGHVQT